jgi:serine protease Do
MRSNILSRTRKWLGASALAIMVGIGGGSALLAASTPGTMAQVQPAAQITLPAPATPTSFADLVEAVKPAVVSIIVEGEQGSRNLRGGGREFNFDFPDLPEGDLRDFLERFGNQFGQGPRGETPGQQNRAPARKFMAAGSGFAISADGYFVTNNHVVENAEKVTVVFDDGDEMTATVVGTDERTDLAVVKVDGVTDLPFVNFATDDVRVGDWVVAVGNPFGLGGTVTAGIISGRGRDIAGSAQGDFLQIDAAVNTGNSGGPAFNLKGEVVGVNTAIFSPNGGNVGIAFAIPSNIVQQVAGQLIESGTVTRGYLGVGIQDVNRDIADSVGLESPRGALVTEPAADGPAQAAGIRSGDIITKVDGVAIANALALSRTIAGKGPDTEVEITLFRDGAEQTLTVTLSKLDETTPAAPVEPEAPVEEEAGPTESSVGITLVPNGEGEGLLVQDIDPSSIAAEKGFAVGDTILEVDNQKVATTAQFEDAIAGVRDSGRGTALIKAERNGQIRYLGLPLANR